MEKVFEETLNLLPDLLRPLNGKWVLIGTTSLYLQGFSVVPSDIDILCDVETALQIELLLKPYFLPFDAIVTRDKFNSLFSRYRINGIKVEVMGDLQVNTGKNWVKLLDSIEKFESKKLGVYSVKIPSKADQIKIYELFGREKDKKILAMLKI